MFTIKANHTENIEFNVGLDKVLDFFSDIKNFIDLMPGIESIHQDNNGIFHWKIRAEVPFVGSFVEKFAVREAENSDERIEWSPVADEQKNFLRYAAEFLPKNANKTLVQFSQNLELRRRSASELHLLAGFAGETLISNEMTRHVAEMLQNFLQKAKERLEK